MPRIVNAYAENSAIGDSLAKLGEAIYGDQAAREVNRQKAFGLKRENDNAEPLAAAVRDGNRNSIGYYGVLAGKTGQDAGDYGRFSAANHATSFDDPRLATSMMGAGGAASNTAIGQRRALDNNITTTGMNNATTLKANDLTSQRAADTQLAIDGRTLVPVDNGDGTSHYDTRTNAAGQHLPVPVTKEGVLGGMLRKYAAGNAPTTVADANNPAATTGAPVAPAVPFSGGNPFSGLPPQLQHVLGVGMTPQSMVHPQTGQTGVSYDGGQTIVDGSGRTAPATGFLPVGQETALGQARDNNVRAGASQPLVVGNPATSQAATDAASTSGIGPKVATIFNEDFGAIPGVPSVLKAATGSPEVAPDVQRSRAQQDVRNNQARAVLLGAPGRQTTQAQKWVNDLLPQGNAFSNPATEAAKIPTVVNALQGDHEQLRQIAIDPNTLPAERVKVTQQMHQIENTIRMYTDPAPTSPTAATGPQSTVPTQTATNPQTGQRVSLVNGQWVPVPASQTDRAAAEAPPMAGAQKAPDGNWYVKQGNQYFRVEQPGAPPASDPLFQARDAIARGADPAAVRQRLQQNGIDPAALTKPQTVIQNGHTYDLQADGSYR